LQFTLNYNIVVFQFFFAPPPPPPHPPTKPNPTRTPQQQTKK